MQSDVIVNVKDINANNSDDIIVPNTDSASSPNTGYLSVDENVDTSFFGNNVLVLGILSSILIAIVLLVLITKRHYIRLILRCNKRAVRALTILAILVSAFSFIGLKNLNNSYNLAKAEGDNSGSQTSQRNPAIPEDTLAISTENTVINIDLGNDPVFAYAKETVTVAASTETGYSLVAYIDGDTKDLANTTNAEATDARIAGLTSLEPQALNDNTWGLALKKPENEESIVFYGLPAGNDTPLTLKESCAATEVEDVTDVYIGAYVVPGLPGGTYSGITINYAAVANVAVDSMTVNYHGNGLFFNEDQTKNENTVVYETYRSAIDSGNQKVCGIFNKSGVYENIFGSDNSNWYSQISKPGVVDLNNTLEFSGENGVKEYLMENHDMYKDQTIDLYATKNYTIRFDANGGEGEMADQQIASGKLNTNTFTMDDYFFNRWNTKADGSGTFYSDKQQVNQIAKPGQVITLYAQWGECANESICYKKNGDDVVGSMDMQTIPWYSNDATLSISKFERENYDFAGWNTKSDYTGTFYGPHQTVEKRVYANGLTLYAVWVPVTGTLQGWRGCNNLTQDPNNGTATLSSVTALIDTRDGQIYTVAKLADGKCWMTENLRLDNIPELNADNTNNPSLPITNIYGYSTSNHLSQSSSSAFSEEMALLGWCDSSTAECLDQSRLRTNGEYGNYYNWYSATAGHGKYLTLSGDTAGDICPVGWHLPTGANRSGEFKTLNDAINGTVTGGAASNKMRSFPSNFYLSGSVSGNGSIEQIGSSADYWTSSSQGLSGAYALRLNIGFVDYGRTGNGIVKYRGGAVRCISNL